MCMYSLYANNNAMRKAKVGETLTKGQYRSHGAFLTDEGPIHGMLACIRHGTLLTINEVRFQGVAAWLGETYGGRSLTVKFVEISRRSWGRHYAADGLELPDGIVLCFDALADGVTAFIPRKVRKDKGVRKPRNLDKVFGLDHVAAILPPDPKPEDAPVDAPSSEPVSAPVDPKPVPVEPAEPAAD